MNSWKSVYSRIREDRQFTAYFGRNGRIPKESDFELRVYNLPFENVSGYPAQSDHPVGPLVGPLTQTFDYGCVILGILSGCYAPQQAVSTQDYGPSSNVGRRDLFVLHIARTDDERITSDQLVLTPTTFDANVSALVIAESLTGNSVKDIFPQEIIVAPSQGLSVSVAALVEAAVIPSITVNVAFHAMVPRV